MKAIFILDEQEIKEMITNKIEVKTEADIEVEMLTDFKFTESDKSLTVTINDWS